MRKAELQYEHFDQNGNAILKVDRDKTILHLIEVINEMQEEIKKLTPDKTEV